jgi:hypothetical protein
MLCADHGPCVSGAHNSIVTARAGKDLVSSLVSGELVQLMHANLSGYVVNSIYYQD